MNNGTARPGVLAWRAAMLALPHLSVRADVADTSPPSDVRADTMQQVLAGRATSQAPPAELVPAEVGDTDMAPPAAPDLVRPAYHVDDEVVALVDALP